MKTICSFILLMCMLPLSAQLTIENNRLRIGDEIVKQQVVYKDPGRSGVNVIWDFSKLEAVNPEYKLSYEEPYLLRDSINIMGTDTFYLKREDNHNELLRGIEHYTAYHYQMQGDTLYCLGHENPTSLLRYNEPIVMMPYPFSYGQKVTGSYTADGLYSSRDSVLSYGTVQLEFDAMGKMILPSKDTLDHVMRIRKVQTIKKDSISRIGQDAANTIIETCQWYSKGYRYPVFETIRTLDLQAGEKVFFSTAFFYPPQEHYYLENDEANLALLDSLNNGGDGGITDPANPDDGGGSLHQGEGYAYNFYPNPVTTDLYVEYLLDEPATVGLSLYDMNGRQLKSYPSQQQLAGLYEEQFDMSNVPSGSYILRISINNKIINEKIVRR